MGRKVAAAVTAVACLLVLTSCQLLDPILDPPDKYPDDIDHLSNGRMDQIVDLLGRQDAEGLRSLFSPRALADAEDLDEGMEDAFAAFAGELDWASGNNFTPAEFTSSESKGDYWKFFTPFCADFADGRQYQVYFLEYVENTADPDLVGLYSLRIDVKPEGWCVFGDAFDGDEVLATTADPGAEVPGVVVNDGGSS